MGRSNSFSLMDKAFFHQAWWLCFSLRQGVVLIAAQSDQSKFPKSHFGRVVGFSKPILKTASRQLGCSFREVWRFGTEAFVPKNALDSRPRIAKQ